jgi:hypothetical protein
MILINLHLDLNIKTPSHVSILLWMKKLGVYKLTIPKEKSDDWILMIDESIAFGHDKLLVILGIRESKVNFGRALQYHDMTCLKLMASGSWKGEDIKQVLDELTLEIGTIKYVVADMGNSIKKALRLSSLTHIEDINHKISWFIKELYKDDEHFKSYTKKLAHYRGALNLTNMSHMLPPAQRVNSRYMNLKPIFKWGMAILKMLEDETSESSEKEKMNFVKDYEILIRQSHRLIEIANQIQEILKNNGLSEKTKKDCLELLDKENDPRILKFKKMITEFLINKIVAAEGCENILCSSDILESSFGKYKNYISDNISVGITNLALSIPAFGSRLEKPEIKKAMEAIKVSHLNDWSLANIGKTQTIKRRTSLKVERRKKIIHANF